MQMSTQAEKSNVNLKIFLSLQENLPDYPQDDEKVKWHAFLSPLGKIVSTSLWKAYTSFADVNLCKFLYCHTKLPSWSTWTLETHVKKILFFLKLSFDFENEKLSTHTIEVEMSCSSFAKWFYGDIASTIKMVPDLLRTLMSSC